MAQPSSAILRARAHWRNRGDARPSFAEPTGPGQESVWDYPRPPRIEADARRVVVEWAGQVVADSTSALRVLETASPPTVYVPLADVRADLLRAGEPTSVCEWKGAAVPYTLDDGQRQSRDAAWRYPDPFPEFEVLHDRLAFYPARVDACWFGDDRVEPQPGGYYGGWVTPELVGPFKGEPGTGGW